MIPLLDTINIAVYAISAATFFILQHYSTPLSRSLVANFDRLKPHQVPQWNVRVASSVHAIVVTPLSLYVVLFSDELRNHPITGYTTVSNILFSIALGYFTWDLYICIKDFKEHGLPFLIHGTLCFIVYFGMLSPTMQFYGSIFLLYEASTPFINTAWMLSKIGSKNELLMKACVLITIILFFFIRLVLGTYETVICFRQLIDFSVEGIPLVFRLIYIPIGPSLVVLNFYWFYAIVMFVLKPGASDPEAKSN